MPPHPDPDAERKAELRKARIDRINEISGLARTAWFTLMGYLVFVGITLLGVRDADFFVPSRQTDLPLVNVSIPTASFFWTAPVLGAALYIYLHLFLIKLWDAHGEARTSDADATHHWLVNDFALIRQGDPVARARPLWRLTDWITRLLVWVAGPFVLAYAWWRSMPAHEEWLTLLIALCLWLTLVVGFTSWWRAEERLPRRWPSRWAGWFRRGTAALAALLLVAVSWLRTEGGLDYPANRLIDLYERTARHTLFEDGRYPDGDVKPAQLVQKEWVAARFPTLDTFTAKAENPWIGRWIDPSRPWNPLARTDLTDPALVPPPADWRTPETARAAFRETWCSREGLSMEVCDQPVGPDHATPSHVAADREKWCGEHRKLDEAACSARFADLDARFAVAWDEERKSARANLPALYLHGRDLRRAEASGASLVRGDLREARLEGAVLTEARMEGAVLTEARMEGANLWWARMEGADLRWARMKRADLRWARMEGADLTWARMEGAVLRRARMEGADLTGARMAGAVLTEARMAGADLTGARMEGADLRWARMEGAVLQSARMAGAVLWGARMEGADLKRARMEGADLRRARMEGADLSGADLRKSQWARASNRVSPAHFADFRGAQDLTQEQLEEFIGNTGTLLPDGNAPDTRQPYYIWSCWETPPDGFDELIESMPFWLGDPSELRDKFLCQRQERRKLYNGRALDAPYPPGHPLADAR